MTFLRGLAVLFAGMLSICAVRAAEWPDRPVKIVVPFAAGGSTDVTARLVAEVLTRRLGQQFYVENRTGSNGLAGTEGALKSAPDGYTILVAPDSTVSNPHVYKANYDPLTDLIPVVQLTRQPIVLAVHPSLGVTNLQELIAKVKVEPGLRYGTGSGFGSGQHMVAQWFAKLAGIELEQVSYRGGGQAITDLVAGHIKLGSLGSTPLIPFHRDGKLLMIAQTTASRAPSLPDVPTFGEGGVKDLVIEQWLGVFLPVGTPPVIAARLNAEINTALADPSIRAKLDQLAQEPVGGTPETMAKLLQVDFEKYGRLARELNVRVN